MPAIYRQYRPKTFAEISGQSHITDILAQEILSKHIAHAYLFQGPRGTGKTSTARVFAKRLNCTKSTTAEPCGTCDSCTAFQENRFMDILEIDAASNRGIDDIRALRETASLAPTGGAYKIYIIDEVHMLSAPAFAALLKLLEEPPRHVIFILATTELQKVPATIASRCQVFRFRRASAQDMRTRIQHILKSEKRESDDDVLSFIIARSDGCYRDAESLLGQLLSQSEKKLVLTEVSSLLGVPSPETINSFVDALTASDAKTALDIATTAYEDGFDPDQFLQESIYVTRERVVEAITNRASAQRLTTIMRAFLVASQDMTIVPDPMIAIEIAIVTSCATPTSSQQPVSQPVQSKPQPVAVITQTPQVPTPPVQPTPQPVATGEDATILQAIKNSWDGIVQAMRSKNPVASTFLRATTPTTVQQGVLVLGMQFPLHKTFFEKPENRALVAQCIMDASGQTVTIQCQLQDAAPSLQVVREQKQQQEDTLLKNVQEVFGAKATS